jgi:hypothetical protein
MNESGHNLQWLINIKGRPISRRPMHFGFGTIDAKIQKLCSRCIAEMLFTVLVSENKDTNHHHQDLERRLSN